MPWFMILIIAWFVLRSLRRRGYAQAQFHGCAGGARMRQRQQHAQLPAPLPIRHDTRVTRARSPAERPLSRFERLKQRYVSGELSDEQYEHEVDALLREPGGMSEIR